MDCHHCHGVDQNYTIVLDTYTIEITQHYYVYHNTSDSDIQCSVHVYFIAVNGAGESDPSDIVNIPSLLASLVWKHDGINYS